MAYKGPEKPRSGLPILTARLQESTDELEKAVNQSQRLQEEGEEPLEEGEPSPNIFFVAREKSPEPSSIIIDENYQQLTQGLSDAEFYDQVAEMIGKKNEGKEFTQRLDNILPVIEWIAQEARNAAELAETDEDKEALAERARVCEGMQKMLLSVRSLANSKTQYTEKYYAEKCDEIFKQGTESSPLQIELDDIMSGQLFDGRKLFDTKSSGYTPFEAGTSSKALNDEWKIPDKVKKRVKIEYDEQSSEVTVQFSHHRGKLYGLSRFSSPAEESKELQSQAAEVVMVALHELNKGTTENPIAFKYANTVYPQPETVLAMLMEFKKQAILSKTVLYARDHNGEAVEISPSINFNDKEAAYFSHYFDEMAVVKGKSKKETPSAGEALFRQQEGFSMDNPVGVMSAKLDIDIRKITDDKKSKIEEVVKAVASPRTGIS